MTALFRNRDLAADAIFTPAATGVPVDIRAIRKAPDDIATFQGARFHVATTIFDVRQSEVPAPRPGDTIAFSGTTYAIQGEPQSDSERLIWTLDTRPA